MRLINRSDGCVQNQKDWPRHTSDIKAGALRTLNDAHSINHATLSKNASLNLKNDHDLVIASRPLKKGQDDGGKCFMPY